MGDTLADIYASASHTV